MFKTLINAFLSAYEQYKFVNSPEVKAARTRATQRGYERAAHELAMSKIHGSKFTQL